MKRLFLTVVLSTMTVTLAYAKPDAEAVKVNVSPYMDQKSPRYFENQEDGWFWYKDPVIEKKKEEEPPPLQSSPAQVDPSDPLEQLKEVQEKLNRAQAKMVLNPTEENVLEWVKLNRENIDRGSMLADVGQRLLWSNPQLGYALERPANNVGMKAWSTEYNKEKDSTLRELAQTHGLFFFFAESCAVCHEIAPYVRRFAEQYGFSVVAMSIDGGGLADFPDSRYEPRVAERLGVKTTPAIFLVNPSEEDIQPIAYGAVSLSELEDRIYRLMKMPVGQTVFDVSKARRE